MRSSPYSTREEPSNSSKPTIEFYDGSEWVSLLLGSLEGTDHQITVTEDPETRERRISISVNPTLPGDTTIESTGFLKLPVGTEAQRPETPEAGMIRFKTGA